MATWEALKSYIHSNYKVMNDNGNHLAMGFDLDGGRHQNVLVSFNGEVGGVQFAEVGTAVAKESQINHRDLLVRNANMVCGGLHIMEMNDSENLVIFAHRFPLADLDPSEFEVPLRVAIFFGDKLEQELTGGDAF